MTESQPATTDLGVVDPIRIPGAARARRLWTGLPRLSKVFVGLAALDIVVRGLGIFGTSLFLELGQPVTWLTAFMPHTALILLPAVIAARRPSVVAELPLVAGGAVTVALVELLNDPVRGIASQVSSDQFVLPVLVAMLGALATAAGWIAVARGMRSFTPRMPSQSVAVLAYLVAGGLALGAIVAAAEVMLFYNELGGPGSTELVRVSNAVVALSGLGLAYLALIVVRGTGDPHRPVAATRLATISLAAFAVGALLLPFLGQSVLWIVLALASHTFALTGFVVAFGLGLADPSGRIEPAVTNEPTVSA